MEKKNTSQKRMKIIYFGFLAFYILALGQIIYLQFFTDYKNHVAGNPFRSLPVEANRGSILAYDGRMLASTVPYYEIRWDCKAPTDDNFNKNVIPLSKELATMFPYRSAREFETLLRQTREKGTNRYLQLSDKDVTFDQLTKIKQFPLFNLGGNKGGIIAVQNNRRVYPYGRLGYRTIGYILKDQENGVGIEYAYNSYLKGKPGVQMMQRAGISNWAPIGTEPIVQPQDGLDVVSTLDIEIQSAAEEALRKQLAQDEIFEGATAVVMEVKSGAVRAIVNMKRKPDGTYDETFNYAISESTNPGSTFKLATLIALLEDNKVTLDTEVETGSSGWRYGGHTFLEAGHSYGTLTVKEALEKSSNVAFAMLAVNHYADNEKQFINRLYNMKLNDRLNIELIGEGRASIPFPGEPLWSKLSLPMIAIGYEMQLTPLHTLTLYNAVANNGKVVTPYFIERLEQHGRIIKQFTHQPLSNALCTDKTLKTVKEALRGVVENGTAKRLNDPRYAISGKTGTAQIAFDGVYKDAQGNRKHQASFVGFFPSDAPKYSMIVVLYSGKTRQNFYGGSWAAPVFKEIADHIYVTHPFWNQPIQTCNLTD